MPHSMLQQVKELYYLPACACNDEGMPHRTYSRKHSISICVVHAKTCAPPASTLTTAGLGGA